MGPRGEDSNERAYSATRRTKVVSTPATEPRMRSLLSGSTIVSVLKNVMSSGLSGRLDTTISRSSEGQGMPYDRLKIEKCGGDAEARERNIVVETSLSTVSGSLIQFSGIVAV